MATYCHQPACYRHIPRFFLTLDVSIRLVDIPGMVAHLVAMPEGVDPLFSKRLHLLTAHADDFILVLGYRFHLIALCHSISLPVAVSRNDSMLDLQNLVLEHACRRMYFHRIPNIFPDQRGTHG